MEYRNADERGSLRTIATARKVIATSIETVFVVAKISLDLGKRLEKPRS